MREFQWDAKNRLVKLTEGTQETEFVYDGLDRRVQVIQTENGVELSNQVFIWDGTEIIQKRDSAGSTVERSYFGQGFQKGSNNYYYTKDHLGSIREVVASNGHTVESVYDYSPWGEVSKIGGTGAESDFLYTGHFYHGESDLHLTLYRAYNPELGMWLSRDPIAENGGINLYAYVGNDPINYWDPLGLESFGGDISREINTLKTSLADFGALDKTASKIKGGDMLVAQKVDIMNRKSLFDRFKSKCKAAANTASKALKFWDWFDRAQSAPTDVTTGYISYEAVKLRNQAFDETLNGNFNNIDDLGSKARHLGDLQNKIQDELCD